MIDGVRTAGQGGTQVRGRRGRGDGRVSADRGKGENRDTRHAVAAHNWAQLARSLRRALPTRAVTVRRDYKY